MAQEQTTALTQQDLANFLGQAMFTAPFYVPLGASIVYVLVRLDSPHLNGATADCAEAESGARGFSLGYIHFVGFPAVPLQTAGSYPPIHQSIKLPIYLCICSILLFVC